MKKFKKITALEDGLGELARRSYGGFRGSLNEFLNDVKEAMDSFKNKMDLFKMNFKLEQSDGVSERLTECYRILDLIKKIEIKESSSNDYMMKKYFNNFFNY